MKPKQPIITASYSNIKEPITFTSTWVHHDLYEHTEKVNRLMLLKWLIRGSFKFRWSVPYNKKDKRLHIEGVKL